MMIAPLEELMEFQATAAARQETCIEAIIARATEVIGNKDEALRWLGSPVRTLAYKTPISLMGSDEGQAAVEAVLSRLEHGVL